MLGICREIYEKNGILTTDTRPFNPHLTLFKLSKAPDLYRKGVRKIDESWTSKYTGHHFGIETFRSLHLCNMLKKQTDGYYEIFNEQDLCKFENLPLDLLSNISTSLNAHPIDQKMSFKTRTAVMLIIYLYLVHEKLDFCPPMSMNLVG